MANRLLRTIAVTIGAGLAVGLGRKLAARRTSPSAAHLTPILDRLDDIENRVAAVESSPSTPALPAPEEIEAIGTLVSSQSEDIATLRQDILRIERRNAEQVEAFGQKVALMERQVPASIEASVNAKMAELEQKLRGEFHDIHYRTVDAFSETIEKRVIGRINALENNLIEQSRSIGTLREKSFRTEDHLQKLLEAVEKLCARAEAQTQSSISQLERAVQPPAPPPPPETPTPRQAHSAEEAAGAAGSTPEIQPPEPAVEPVPDSEPEPQTEPEMAFAGTMPEPDLSIRRGFKPLGMAILGLAIIGFRLIR
jgi:hypothetical protein